MSPKKHEETEEEKKELSVDEMVSRKMKIVYAFQGVLLAIYISIAWPIVSIYIDTNKAVTELKATIESKFKDYISEDKAFDRFLTKDSYHQLQKDEHLSDIEAIQNPQNADVIYMRQNNRESEKLGVSYSRSGNSNN